MFTSGVCDKVSLPIESPDNTTDQVPLPDDLLIAKRGIQGFIDEVAQKSVTARPQIYRAWNIYQSKAAVYDAAKKELTVSTESASCSNLPIKPPAVDELTRAEHAVNVDMKSFLALLEKAKDATTEMAKAREEFLRVKSDEELRLRRRERALETVEELNTW